MRTALALALLLCAAVGFGVPATSSRLPRVSFAGRDYTPFDAWARANGFQWRWTSKNDFVATKGAKQMQFNLESRNMSLNGVTVRLSQPVRAQNGAPYLAEVDFTTVLQPILYPPKNRARGSVKNICIDPGHGGRDPGKQVGGEQEKKYSLLLALELATQLRKEGYTVSLTRISDEFIDLPVRPSLARRRGADLFISLHFNSFTDREVHGVETYCMTPQRESSSNAQGEGAANGGYVGNLNNARNMVLAYELHKSIVTGTRLEDRGIKRARFQVLREAEIPAVLIEGGFMSNPSEARNIYSATWRRQFAQSIVNGVQSYRRMVEP